MHRLGKYIWMRFLFGVALIRKRQRIGQWQRLRVNERK
jgi:hypothetical protein